MTFKLTKRLVDCYNLLPNNRNLLDVGADRGYLAIYYEKNNKSKVFASENKNGPYKALCQTISENNSHVISLFGNGLDVLNDEIDTLSILGMGGNTIYKILNENKTKLKNIKYIIVSPQSNFNIVFKLLNSLEYKNIKGKYIFETKYYPILLYEKGKENLIAQEERYGKYPFNHKDDNLIKYLKKEKKRYSSIEYKDNEDNKIIYNQIVEDLKILNGKE